MNDQLSFYRNKIQSLISNLDSGLLESGNIDKVKMGDLINLVEAFTVLANISDDAELVAESEAYERKLECYTLSHKVIQQSLNEGFTNPFAKEDKSIASYANANANATEYQNDIYRSLRGNERKDIKISNIHLWNSDTANKIMFENGRMKAGQYFGKGDTIEKCPIRIIYDRDLYSENVRKFAFALDKAKGVYGIPFGYATYYRNSRDTRLADNSDYEYVIGNTPENSYLKIYATKPIKKGSEIILHSDETDFENEVKPGQFEYNEGEEPYCSIKNFKIL
jgi:hypothetical protein